MAAARNLSALFSGALFGSGLVVSGMIDTAKVQGWLDVFGAWDPTLAFVLGGAVLPMILVWRVAERRGVSVLGTPIPARVAPRFDPRLVTGSVLFGAGWALAGFCPGPALASFAIGGWGGALFLLAMVAGMVAAPALSARLPNAWRAQSMDIRALTPDYAVSPQIDPAHLPAIKAAGYVTVIDNRPDGEIPPDLHTDVMRKAAEALGLTFVANPIIGGAMTQDNVVAQRAAIDASSGPVFAYCASGNRSSVVWALAHAGERPADELIGIPARFGYNLEHLRPMLTAKG